MDSRMPASTVRSDFPSLWDRLVSIATSSGDDRMKASLMNHSGRKEYICRKLGVVTEDDVHRLRRVSRGG